jgi:hypothetical protein
VEKIALFNGRSEHYGDYIGGSIRISQSIYPCDKNYYVFFDYTLPNSKCVNSSTFGAFKTLADAEQAKSEFMPEWEFKRRLKAGA